MFRIPQSQLKRPRLARMALICVVFCLLSTSNYSANAEAVEPSIIALFGDSITVGYNQLYSNTDLGNGTTTHGRPTIDLNNLLNESKPKRSAVVANWGDGGTSSENGAWRISRELEIMNSQYSGSNKYVLILIGTNDSNFGISTSDTKFNIQMMIDDARTLGFEPIIGTLTPVSNRNVQPRNTQIKSAAASRNAFLVDHYTRFINEPGSWTQLIELDGGVRLHPNDSGYLVIAQTWFEQRLQDVIPVSAIAIPGIIQLILD